MANFKKSAFVAQELNSEYLKEFIYGTSSKKLTDKQLKAAIGGQGYDPNGPVQLGTCCAKSRFEWCICGISKQEAWNTAGCNEEGENCSRNWCCDSCSSTGWTDNCF